MTAQRDTGGSTFARYRFALLTDHGLLRLLVRNNAHWIADGIIRSGQPLPGHLERLVQRYGLKSVLSLRMHTRDAPHQDLERDACQRLGLALRQVKLRAGRAPKRRHMHELVAALHALQRPALIHCKSGIDRSGLAATLYLHLVAGQPIESVNQLRFWPYLYLPNGASGILKQFLAAYAAHPLAREHRFLDWVDTVYDPESLAAHFEPVSLGELALQGARARRAGR